MDEVLLRDATAADIPVLAALHVASWRDAYRGMVPEHVLDRLTVEDNLRRWAERWERRGETGDEIVVAEADGGLTGFCAFGAARGEDGAGLGEIQNLHLLPAARRRGTGSRLIEMATGRLAARGFPAAVLWVLRDNRGARAFYAAAGWAPDGATADHPWFEVPVPEVRYRRDLG